MKLDTSTIDPPALFPVWKNLLESTAMARDLWVQWRHGKPNAEGMPQRLEADALAQLEKDYKAKKRALQKLRSELVERDPAGFQKYTERYYKFELVHG